MGPPLRRHTREITWLDHLVDGSTADGGVQVMEQDSWLVVTLHSPEDRDFSRKTLEEALAWCVVWLTTTGTRRPTSRDWGQALGIGSVPG